MGEIPDVLHEVLSYLGVPREGIPSYSNSLNELIYCVHELLEKITNGQEPFSSATCTVPAPQLFSEHFPNFLQGALLALRRPYYGVLSVSSSEQNQGRLLQQLEQDVALLRHVSDFVQDVAQWTMDGEAWESRNHELSLYPACDVQHEQAFWKAHQEQVILQISLGFTRTNFISVLRGIRAKTSNVLFFLRKHTSILRAVVLLHGMDHKQWLALTL
jgi:hypothetical protein